MRFIVRHLLVLPLALFAIGAGFEIAHAESNDDFWTRERLLGEWGGWQPRMRDAGVLVELTENAEMLHSSSGGIKRGTIGEGRLDISIDVDGQTAFGWDGLLFHATAYDIHGAGLTRCCVGNLATVSNLEAHAIPRLFTLWAQQTLFDGQVSIRIGQLAADDDFSISSVSAMFINGTFGWPAIAANNLPSGGPAYSSAAPGIRIRYAPDENWTLSGAIFSGDPARPGQGDSQLRDSNGLAFNFSGDALLFGEAQFVPQPSTQPNAAVTVYKLGYWYHVGHFYDLRFDRAGLTLADSRSSGHPGNHSGNWSIYATTDQVLWRNGERSDETLSGFIRLGLAPSDRNLVSFYADAGFAWKGLFADRPDDALGLSASWLRSSSAVSGLDRDTCSLTRLCAPVHGHEAVVELTYQYALTPWLQLQPDLQYIIHPGSSSALKDAFVQGVRAGVRF
jgi:porin